jgi:SAM-dependent methyltransferase
MEIGASHSPLIPKHDGWNTCVVDHTTRNDLIKKYSHNEDRAKIIEEVDVVWAGGALHEFFPISQRGSYDAIVASHVLEHMPDPIGFMKSCEMLLKPEGKLVLALPDKRRCFDFFGNLSTTGDLLESHMNGNITHTLRAAFNDVAYAVKNNGAIGWGPTQEAHFGFVHSLDRALGCAKRSRHFPSEYFDHHGWRFVPSSFSLIVLELGALKYIDYEIEQISEVQTQEFFVRLARQQVIMPTPDEFASRRMSLLKENLRSMALQLEEMESQ